MKKRIYIFSLGLIFFSGCGKIISGPYSTGAQLIEVTTGIIMGWPDDTSDIYQWQQKTENGDTWYEAIISGYKYIAIYDDLGIKISLNDPYTELFFTIPNQPVFIRTGNMIYNNTMSEGKLSTADTPSFFVEMFTKQTGENLANIIQNKHLSSGCIIKTVTEENELFSQRSGKDDANFFEIMSPDGSMGDGSLCVPDNQHPETLFGIYYLQSKYHQDRYYKISYPAACAPSCGMFNAIEFF